MSLFPDFSNNFQIGRTISENANADPDDVLKTKNALMTTGHYEVPSFGVTDIPDRSMIDGLKKFQKQNGLKVDGVMKPGGSTESAIGHAVKVSASNKPSDSHQGNKDDVEKEWPEDDRKKEEDNWFEEKIDDFLFWLYEQKEGKKPRSRPVGGIRSQL